MSPTAWIDRCRAAAVLAVAMLAGCGGGSSSDTAPVAPAIAIASFAPAQAGPGATVTVTGSGFDAVQSAKVGTTSASFTIDSATQLRLTVPDGASSGPIELAGGGRATQSANALVVLAVPRIQVDATAVYNVAAGAAVTISGTGLNEVSAVTVGANAATIGARSDTLLSFAVPAGVNCGPITLLSQSQPSVPAGSVVVGAGCTVRSAGIEFAQVYAQSAGANYQRLVPGKETWVRAYVVAEAAGTAAPVVRLTGFNGTTTLGTVAMTGPAVLPQLAAGATVPDSMRYNEALTFNANLPAAWVGGGLQVRVEIDPDRRYGNPIVVDATPNVGTATRIDLVLVPLVSGGNVPQMPAAADVADEIVRRLPIARENVSVSVRTPYTLTTVTDGVDTSNDWSSALGELETLRRSEARTKHYYGFVRPMVSAGTAGIGYVNRVGSTSPNLSAVGWDASRASWRRTFSHELGHNFSREHAPCGGVANPDPNYPYPNGALSGTPLFDSLLDDIVSPAGMSDIMGYCSGAWFSDYNFREVQRFVEAQPQSALSVQSAGRTAEILIVSGSIGLDGVRFNPVQRLRGVAPAAEAGEYMLRLVTAAGATIEVPFDAVRVDHAMPAEQHFFVKLPDPGELAELAVLRGASELPLTASSTVRAQAHRAPAPPASAWVDWSEDAGALALAWNAAAYRYLGVTHVAEDGARRVLAVLLAGGSARIDVADLARGGEFEFALSDGLNTRLLVMRR